MSERVRVYCSGCGRTFKVSAADQDAELARDHSVGASERPLSGRRRRWYCSAACLNAGRVEDGHRTVAAERVREPGRQEGSTNG